MKNRKTTLSPHRAKRSRKWTRVLTHRGPVFKIWDRRITGRTGGRAYWAKTWQRRVEAFESIRGDLGNSDTITYYPAPNPNEGFRKITVEIVTDPGKRYRVRARPGYPPAAGSEPKDPAS